MVESPNDIQGYALVPSLIELTGRDRLKWLHSFVTNEIRNLSADSWQETFVTDSKGKSFSHGCVVVVSDRIFYLSVSPNQESGLMAMWDRYIISEDVVMRDASNDLVWLYSPAAGAERLLKLLNVESNGMMNVTGKFQQWNTSDSTLQVIAIYGFALAEDYVLFGIPKDLYADYSAQIVLANESETRGLAAQAFFPWFGIDFSQENLPQEVDRDALAISFKKGCYLGQETIARLDALGQVQKKLFPVKIVESRHVQAPTQLLCIDSEGGEPTQAGVLTSAYSAASAGAEEVGFAMIRRKYFSKVGDLCSADGSRVQPRIKTR